MNQNLTLIIAVGAAILGPLIAYITTSRKLSGRVETSEAESLWAESASIREDYRSRLADAEKRQAHLEERLAAVEQRNNDLALENLDLKRMNAEQALTITRLERRVEDVSKENESLKNTIKRLGGFDGGE